MKNKVLPLFFIFGIILLCQCSSEKNNQAMLDSLQKKYQAENEAKIRELVEKNQLLIKQLQDSIRNLESAGGKNKVVYTEGGNDKIYIVRIRDLQKRLNEAEVELKKVKNIPTIVTVEKNEKAIGNLDDLIASFQERKRKIDELTAQINEVKSSERNYQEKVNQLEKKLDEEKKEKERLEKEIVVVNMQRITVTECNYEFLTTGFSSKPENIKIIQMNCIVNDHPLAESGKKWLYVVIEDSAKTTVYRDDMESENPTDSIFVNSEGQKVVYSMKTQIDYEKTQKLDVYLEFHRGTQRFAIGEYNVTFYIDGYMAGLSTFKIRQKN